MIEFEGLTGKRHRLVVSFKQIKSRVVEGAFFATESAFPTPGVYFMLDEIGKMAESNPETHFLVVGHTDEKGGEADNKKLADRRAKAIFALLTRDLELFGKLAEEDGWETKHYQAMLRAVGCNPGAIDNEEGDLTKEAITGFQEDYNEDAFHPLESSFPREHDDLDIDGNLNQKTKDALYDAYVSMSQVYIDPVRFVDPKFIGCGEYNLDPELDDDLQRCVMLAFIEGDEVLKFPCKEGDTGSCLIDYEEAPRCKFYRQHFQKVISPIMTDPFFDLEWLQEEDGKVHLSALTRLPDETEVVFKIFRWEDELPEEMPSGDGGQPQEPGEMLGELEGTVSCGVAYARWEPPEDYDLFDMDSWYIPLDDYSPSEQLDEVNIHPPVFLVQTEDQWAFSLPPVRQLDRIQIEDAEDDQEESEDNAPEEDDDVSSLPDDELGLDIYDTEDSRTGYGLTLDGHIVFLDNVENRLSNNQDLSDLKISSVTIFGKKSDE